MKEMELMILNYYVCFLLQDSAPPPVNAAII